VGEKAADRSRSAQAREEHGAALVEFALVLPLLVMFLLGIFTGGIAYNRKLAIVNGVREGSRYGATLPVASAPSGCAVTLDCWLKAVASITQQGSEGNLASTVASLSICVSYVYPNGSTSTAPSDSTRKLVRTPSGDTVTAGATCFDDQRPSGAERRVQVTASRRGRIEYFVGNSDVTLASEAITRFEAG
jgi:hypothetical protein